MCRRIGGMAPRILNLRICGQLHVSAIWVRPRAGGDAAV